MSNNIKKIHKAFSMAKNTDHIQIMIEEGKATAHQNNIKYCRCYVCDILLELENKVAKIIGEKQYYETKMTEWDNDSKKGALPVTISPLDLCGNCNHSRFDHTEKGEPIHCSYGGKGCRCDNFINSQKEVQEESRCQ